MVYYRITYEYADGNTEDDFLLKSSSLEDAKWYADHRIDGSYGKVPYVLVKSIKKISKKEAQKMADDNCVNWSDL